MIRIDKIALEWGALHVEQAGSGAPLLLISGLNGLAQPWHGIMPKLAEHFHVITHDHRGLGGSDPWDGLYSVDQIADDVLALMDKLGIAKAHIVGHSLGGAVAQAIAADHPARVAGLVIYASWPGPDAYFARVMNMRRQILTELGVETFLRTGPIGIYPPQWINMHDDAFKAGLPAAIASFPGVKKMRRRMDACLNHDRRASLGKIAAPCMVLGFQDDMSTPIHCSQELAAAIPEAQLVVLPMGGHNAHLVVPDQLAACLLDFFTSDAVKAKLAA